MAALAFGASGEDPWQDAGVEHDADEDPDRPGERKESVGDAAEEAWPDEGGEEVAELGPAAPLGEEDRAPAPGVVGDDLAAAAHADPALGGRHQLTVQSLGLLC